jgi:NAD(P)H dehydrogenase (quinone)
MKALIIHCHPDPSSFNAALTSQATETLRGMGAEVEVSDLYSQGFDPVEHERHYRTRINPETFAPLAEQRHANETRTLPADVTREITRLEWADLVILQFPLWWHAQPAMMKGWFDRVFVSGGLYTSRMRYDTGYFRGKRAICSVTSGAPEAAFGPGGRGGDIDALMWPIQYSLHYMGFDVTAPMLSPGVQGHGYAYQSEGRLATHLNGLLDRWSERLQNVMEEPPLRFPGWEDWDELGRAITPRQGAETTRPHAQV